MRNDESLGDKISVTIIATGIQDSSSTFGYVPRSAAPQPRFGTANIPSVDSVGFNPAPSPAPAAGTTTGPIRTVNPSSLGSNASSGVAPASPAGTIGEGSGLKSRVKDVHMEVPSFLRKKNDE